LVAATPVAVAPATAPAAVASAPVADKAVPVPVAGTTVPVADTAALILLLQPLLLQWLLLLSLSELVQLQMLMLSQLHC
jgi:hypothetical protein